MKLLKAIGFGMIAYLIFIWTFGLATGLERTVVIKYGLIIGSLVTLFFLLKKTKPQIDNIGEIDSNLKNTDLEKEFRIVSYNQNYIQKLKTTPQTNFKLNVQDKTRTAILELNNKKIGYLKDEDFKILRPILNNPNYKIDTSFTIRKENNGYKWMCLYVDINKTEKESEAFHKGFSDEDFLVNKTRKIDSKYLYPRKDLEDTSHYFYGKKIVITGRFEKIYHRNKIAKLLWEVGADVDTSIGKKTDIVILGSYDVGPKKMEQVIEQQIQIIREDEFISHFPNSL